MHIARGLERAISKVIPHQHSADRRASNQAVKAQMDFYQSSKDEMHKQNEEIASEKKMEIDKIHEKQIRSMRNQFRNPGFLGTEPSSGISSQLG